MKKIKLTILALTMILVTACNGSRNNNNYGAEHNTYEESKTSIEDKEKDNPLSFLSIDATYRKNLLGEWVVQGKISNSATVAIYKDVKLSLIFNSKTDTYLGSETQTVYEFVKPGQSKSFKIKTYASGINGKPKKMNLEIVGAKTK